MSSGANYHEKYLKYKQKYREVEAKYRALQTVDHTGGELVGLSNYGEKTESFFDVKFWQKLFDVGNLYKHMEGGKGDTKEERHKKLPWYQYKRNVVALSVVDVPQLANVVEDLMETVKRQQTQIDQLLNRGQSGGGQVSNSSKVDKDQKGANEKKAEVNGSNNYTKECGDGEVCGDARLENSTNTKQEAGTFRPKALNSGQLDDRIVRASQLQQDPARLQAAESRVSTVE